tara:strand:+ start:203 stop:463 length:261 start_codon:yes stop_codon:yes gene_type:complete
MDTLRTLITKWVVEDKFNDQQLGHQIRNYYWREIHSYEHWLNEDEKPQDALDYMYGGGDDVVEDKSSYSDDVGLSGQELDDLYAPI